MRVKFLLMAAMTAFLWSTPAPAGEILTWQNVNWPPIQILRGQNAGEGRFDVLLRLLQERLPQYQHQNAEMNWVRYWEDVKAGKHVLNSMAIKTEERNRYTLFSQIVSFTLPHRIIMTKASHESLGRPASVVLADFIQDDRIRGVLEHKRSYSVPLDAVLNAAEGRVNFERKPIGVSHVLKMLLNGRTGYTVEYPFVVDYLLKTEGYESENSLVRVRIEELPRYVTARIAAPRNPWGFKVINDLDKVIDELKTSRRYLALHQMWHSDPEELALIEAAHQELFRDRPRTVVISGIVNEQTHAMVQAVLREAYNRIGRDVRFELLPGKRSLNLANQGRTDGDIARIAGTQEAYPNLLVVPTPVITFQGVAFTKFITREINSWNDLGGLRVGVIRGIRYSTIGSKGLDPFFADDMTHLFRLLAEDRIDVAVAVLKAGQLETRKHFENSGIHPVGRPLYTASLYHFVHKKHSQLARDLNRALADMAAQDQITTIADQLFKQMLAN